MRLSIRHRAGATLVILPALLLTRAGRAAHGEEPRRPDKLDRAGVVLVRPEGGVYINWRLLGSDPAGVGFDIYRSAGAARPVKVNARPIVSTTDFIDPAPPPAESWRWYIRPVLGLQAGAVSGPIVVTAPAAQFLSIPLGDSAVAQKVGIGDLDGDGALDYVLKLPDENVDPRPEHWRRSPCTYRLQAHAADGRMLWQRDLGWAIECGIPYSPYLVYDLDGDGRAEVALKAGDEDTRDPDGRVTAGREYLAVLNGLTGQTITRTTWLSRHGYDPADSTRSYALASHNQMGIAYLDGRTPAIVVARGVCGLMRVAAYAFQRGHIREIWQWDNAAAPPSYWGQGAGTLHAADLDGDGRDEVVLGSAVLDEEGIPLWTTGLGSPAHVYIGDIDPARPGLEIYYGNRGALRRDAMCLVEAASGKVLWGHDQATTDIAGAGLCADLLPAKPGWECYSGEREDLNGRWLRDCAGNVLARSDIGGVSPGALFWDADRQRELFLDGKIVKPDGTALAPAIEGKLVAVADVAGDWREEIFTSLPGELRIHFTALPAVDRRLCLMADPLYRLEVAVASTGEFQSPTTSYDLVTGRPIPLPREENPASDTTEGDPSDPSDPSDSSDRSDASAG